MQGAHGRGLRRGAQEHAAEALRLVAGRAVAGEYDIHQLVEYYRVNPARDLRRQTGPVQVIGQFGRDTLDGSALVEDQGPPEASVLDGQQLSPRPADAVVAIGFIEAIRNQKAGEE